MLLSVSRPLLRGAPSSALARPLFRSFSSSPSPTPPLVTRESLGDGIVHVKLNNPKKHNSLSMPMFKAISEMASAVATEKEVRVVIFSGEGKSFCTGLDVKGVASNPTNFAKLLERGAGTPVSNLAQDVGYLWRQCPFPVIASLHGKCFGGGMQIALGCDFRFTSPSCEFSIMEAKWGLIPDMSGSVTLREQSRMDWIKELAMTGRIIPAAEAERVGLVTRVVDDPFEESLKVAKEIAARSPDSVALTKKLFQETWTCSEEEALALETKLQKSILPSMNQTIAIGKNFGVDVPFFNRTV